MSRRAAVAGLAALASVVAALGGCGEGASPTQVLDGGPGRATAAPELEARITAQPPEADTGQAVTLRVKLRRGRDSPYNPTSFLASLRYDTASLVPVEVVEPAGRAKTAMRAVNPAAGPGLVRAAGAAPDGFRTATLFAVRMKVGAAGWKRSLSLDLSELWVTRDSLGEVSARIPIAGGVISERRDRATADEAGGGGSRGGGGRRRRR